MKTHDDYDYQSEVGWITLISDARITGFRESNLSAVDQDDILNRIDNCWKLAEATQTGGLQSAVQSKRATLDMDTVAGPQWLDSDFASFFNAATLAAVYGAATKHALNRNWAALLECARRGERIWAGLGALMRYAADFSPAQRSYEGSVDKSMTLGTANLLTQACAVLHKNAKLWRAILENPALQHGTLQKAECHLRSGQSRYYYHRTQVSKLSDSDHDAASQKSLHFDGLKPSIADPEFIEDDDLSNVRRLAHLPLKEFIKAGCDAFHSVLRQIPGVTRLEPESITDLIEGIRASLLIMATWLGPLALSSNHYPRELRGE
ncbi:MAG: hypothetical protein ACREDR_07035 [Blastocatellia bacterium]